MNNQENYLDNLMQVLMKDQYGRLTMQNVREGTIVDLYTVPVTIRKFIGAISVACSIGYCYNCYQVNKPLKKESYQRFDI